MKTFIKSSTPKDYIDHIRILSKCILILAILFPVTSCKKIDPEYISKEEIIELLQGDWIVHELHGSDYPEIDSISTWRVWDTENGLLLETQNVHGTTITYSVDISNYHYDIWFNNGHYEKNYVDSDMKLVELTQSGYSADGYINLYLNLQALGAPYEKRLEYSNRNGDSLLLYDRDWVKTENGSDFK